MEQVQTIPNDHHILLAVQRQVAGLVAERDAQREQIAGLVAERDALRAENERLRAAFPDAIACVEEWAAYASTYFQEKHDLAGDLVRLRAALGV